MRIVQTANSVSVYRDNGSLEARTTFSVSEPGFRDTSVTKRYDAKGNVLSTDTYERRLSMNNGRVVGTQLMNGKVVWEGK